MNVDDGDEVMAIDGFDDCVIGDAMVWHPDGSVVRRLIYAGEAILAQLVDRDGMTHQDAVEYCEVNIQGAYVGESTPIICWPTDLALQS